MSNSDYTQNSTTLTHILSFGSITQIQATYNYEILRLSARIYDLRYSHKLNISTTMVKKKKGKGSYAQYSYAFKSDDLPFIENLLGIETVERLKKQGKIW